MSASAPKRRGRPITGSPKKGADGLWTVRVPIPGTSRTRPVKLGAEIRTEERAKEVARAWYERLLEDPTLLGDDKAPDQLTNGEYLDRWTEERKARIVTAVHVRAALLLHVFDDAKLQNKRCASSTADDLRGVVARLNAKAEAKEIEASTARRLWSQARCMFRQTFDHELDEFRVRKDDPTAGVRPPRKGSEKQKAILYPDEAMTLLSHPDIPIRARRLWGLLMYTGLRVSELRALDWASVDLKHRRIDVHQSIDQRATDDDEDDTKETKTGEGREIDIVAPLFPLLEAMHEESGGKGRVCPFVYERPASMLQGHLRMAGLARAALLKSDRTHRALRAQDLRATCATWLGLAEQLDDGGRSIVGQRVSGSFVRDFLGHADYETTEDHYLRGKGLRIDTVGAPFPALPESLFQATDDGGEARLPAPNTCEAEPIPHIPAGILPETLTRRSTGGTRTGVAGAGSG